MKQVLRWSLSVTALLALLTMSVLAQEQGESLKFKTTADGKAQIEVTKAIGTQFSFETKVVKGAPYSATAEAETIQLLTDGNRIRNKTTTAVYRDGEGRTRREMAGKTSGVAAEVFINDPVSGANYALNQQQRTAVKSQPNIQIRIADEKKVAEQSLKVRTGGQVATINGQAVDQLDEAQRVVIEQKMRTAKEMGGEMKASGNVAPAGGFVMVRKKPGTSESLGQQMIEGVLCEGKRTTVTIPANSIGNELPINIVSEEWYSPELQALVLTKQSDPRNGETSYRLTNIIRSEPARALFEVPADYTVQEGGGAKMRTKKPEEEQE